MIADNLSISGDGRLLFAGQDVSGLAKRFGTPLYLLDADRIRKNCRSYVQSFSSCFPEGSFPLYAGKANSFTAIYRIIKEESMGIDVVSPGEIRTAVNAGFPMDKAYYHGNCKSDGDIKYAMDAGVGCFVVDNLEELFAVNREASLRGMRQKILIRVTPGIDPHTYEAVNTGTSECKFGFSLETGLADEAVRNAASAPNTDLAGLHCHIGSMVFEEDVFERTAELMIAFAKRCEEKYGVKTRELDLGGGIGTRYTEADGHVSVPEKIASIGRALKNACRKYGISEPKCFLEPGRSIVADAGMTVYTVGSVKRIPGYRTYVAVDGGMTDNPRYALYGSRYTWLAPEKMSEPAEMFCTLSGKCCESGDIICQDIFLPESIRRGDYVAVCTTGAYNYSMASNYNRFGRPPVVMLDGGRADVVVRRESLEDLIRLDIAE